VAEFSGAFTMTERMHESAEGIGDDVGPMESNGELVHWMEPKPLSVGPAGISAAAIAAFALGAAVALGVVAMMHFRGSEREIGPVRHWRLRR
jgi:hypothetical protein